MDGAYRIRPAVLADAPALVAIERRSFGDPWSEASFREALGSAWTFVLVAEASRGVSGYLVGRETAGAGEVLNLAGGGGVPRGARVEHLGPRALRPPWIPASGTALGLLPQPQGGRPRASAGAEPACVAALIAAGQ